MEIKQISLSTNSATTFAVTRRAPGFFEITLVSIKKIPSHLFSLLKTLTIPFVFVYQNTILKLLKHNNSSDSSEWTKTQHAGSTSIAKRSKKKFPQKFFLKLLVVLFALAILSIAFRLLRNSSSNKPETTSKVAGVSAEQELDKEFTFPLEDNSGEEVSRIKYTIEKAELRDEIIIQGKKATAIPGRTFLILNIKVTNNHKQGIEINTRDYVRLIVGGNEGELLAPSMHNDPVEVQAISTKYSRLGFPIDSDERDLVLLVGEINGEKEEVRLEF